MSELPLIEEYRREIEALFQGYGVKRLELFGSGATGKFNSRDSDLDFLVEFGESSEYGPADQYFGLLFALEDLFRRKVDLVSARAIRNRYFLEAVQECKVLLYAA